MKMAFTGGGGKGWGGGGGEVKGLWEKNNNTYVATSFDWSVSEHVVWDTIHMLYCGVFTVFHILCLKDKSKVRADFWHDFR